jgi:hypothetical protein
MKMLTLTNETDNVTFNALSDGRVIMANSRGEYAVMSLDEMVERAFWLRRAGWR